jgi:biotin synthase
MKKKEMLHWLDEKDPRQLDGLFKKARACAIEYVGTKVYFRGLIELSNVCSKNCYYCGIRGGNPNVTRYAMTMEEILTCTRQAFEMNYGSVVLQAGERQGEDYTGFIEEVVRGMKALSDGRLGITLSLGEQTPETYERWFKAGAHRYLLRIETSNPALYHKIHPGDHSFRERLDCLRALKRIGYQTGTGVMIGLPGQTREDLVNDIFFFEREDIDMIGMGPYIPHADTPLAGQPDLMPEVSTGIRCPGLNGFRYDAEEQLRLGLVMTALTRIHLKNVNMVAATALQAIDDEGREQGVLAGANIIMPNMTPVKYRAQYQLYAGKPCLNENSRQWSHCLDRRIRAMGAEPGYNEWGDSPHFTFGKNISRSAGILHGGSRAG